MSVWSGTAHGQDETFLLDRAQLSGAPDDGFMVHRPFQGDETRVYVNGAVGFSLAPLRDSHIQPGLHVEGPPPITGQFPFYLSGGLQLLGRLGVNVHVPFTPLQIPGEEPEEANTSGLTDYWAAMNDVRIDARVDAWRSNNRRTHVGFFGAFTIPTGSQHGFGGDRQATGLLAVSAEHTFGKLLITGHIGPHFRPSRSIGDPDGLFVSSELRYAFGAFYPLRDDWVRVGLEIWGSTGLVKQNDESTFFDGRHTTFEWLGQGKFLVSKDKKTYVNAGIGTRMSNGYGSADLRALVSIGRYFLFKDKEPPAPPQKVLIRDRADLHDVDTDGDGYPDDIDACPTVKEDGLPPDPSDGCPAPKDRDKDGIVDDKDKCPDDPEDKDGIQDEDGCPETDADKDLVLDKVDKCPEEPGPPNKNKKKNGCPTLTKVEGDMVTLLKAIEFDYNKATIKPVSYPIFEEVATLMKARVNMKIRIEGHTDNIGSRSYNLRLSEERANAVMDYLVNQAGIAAIRLTAEGFGPDRPVTTNATEKGRAKNRRVDFVIEQEAAPTDKEPAWE